MDFKTEILESYSRIHSRILLSEQGADPRVAKASQVIAGGNLQQDGQVQKGQLPKADGGSVEALLYSTGSIVIGGANAKWDGTTLSPGSNSSQFVKILTMLAGKDGEAQEPGQEEDPNQPQVDENGMPLEIQPGQVTLMSNLSDATKNATALNFVHIAGRAQTIWDKLPQSMQDTFGHIEAFGNFLTGPNPESFEKQLVNAKFTMQTVDGEWVALPEPPQEAQTSLISKSFRDLISLVADGGCDKEVLRDFATSEHGDVLISPKGDQEDRSEALAFRDKTGFLKMLLKKASATCDEEIQNDAKLSTTHTSNPGGDNAIRGFAFEDILETVSLLRLKRKLRGSGKDIAALDKLIKDKTMSINTKLSKLNLDNEVWVKAYEESGLDPNQVGILREIGEILKGGPLTNNLYASMLKHSNQSVKVRGSIYALPVGDQTGSGQRQDVLEIFASPEDAMAAAKRSGISNIKPTCDKVEKAFVGSAKGTLKALQKAGVFSPGQEVCALKVSLKNYMKLDHAVFGGGRYSTFKELVNKPLDSSKFSRTITENLGMDEDDHSSFMDYNKEMDVVGESIYAVPFGNSQIVRKDGTKLDQNLSKNFAEEVLGNLNKNHTFPELDKGELMHLKNLAARVARDTGTDHENSAAYSKLQHRLVSFLQHKKLQKDLGSGDKTKIKQAKMFAAFKMFHAGGSEDNDLMCDYRGLKTGENYIFKQNDPLREAWRSILKNDGEWKLDISAAESKRGLKGKKVSAKAIQIKVSKGKRNLTVSNDTVATKSKGKTTGYNVNYNCKANKDLMQAYSKTKSIAESVELGEILTHIKLLFEKVAIIGL